MARNSTRFSNLKLQIYNKKPSQNLPPPPVVLLESADDDDGSKSYSST